MLLVRHVFVVACVFAALGGNCEVLHDGPHEGSVEHADPRATTQPRRQLTVEEIDDQKFTSLVSESPNYVFVCFYSPMGQASKTALSHLEDVAKRLSEGGSHDHLGALHPNLVLAKLNLMKHKELGRKLKVRTFPHVFFYLHGEEPIEYGSADEITADSLIAFVDEHLDQHRRYLTVKTAVDDYKKAQTADIHPHPGPGQVIDLDALNFDHLVGDPSKAVMVKFYASWCQHCQDFAPQYKQLAESFAHDQSVLIARLDIDKNTDFLKAKEFEIDGVPHFRMFTKGRLAKHDGLQYHGHQDYVPMRRFVEHHSTNYDTSHLHDDNSEVSHHDQFGIEHSEHDHPDS